jgi:hypothetical protein
MLVAIATLLLAQKAPPSLAELNALAKARDVEGLTRLTALPSGVDNPFRVLRTGGAYEVGRFGWEAHRLKTPAGTEYVVLGTPLTSEDAGEILLRREGDRLRYVPESDPLGIRVRDHRLDLRFDIEDKQAILTDRMTFESVGKGDFVVRMSPSYRVSAVADEAGKAVPFVQASGVVAVRRPKAKSAAYTFRYTAKVDLPRYAGSISAREATLVNDYWYPMVARQPSRYSISIKPPEGWTAVAQGVRQEAPEGTFRYRMDLPVTYFSALAMPMKSVVHEDGGRTYRVWSPRLSPEAMKVHAELMVPIVEFYDATFGKWPFRGYGAVDSPSYGGGALEAYSFATYGGGLPDEDAHEPAHTLWGGVINNTYLQSFWNESFAVFSDALYRREVPIGNREERRRCYTQGGDADASFDGAAVFEAGAFDGPIAATLGYDKGAKVLQMLEQWLGTEATTRAMREWLAKHPAGEPGEWEDFERVVARLNPKRDIEGFFDDWGRRPGYAKFSATASYRDGATAIQLSWKGPRYRMPLTILRVEADGQERFDTVWLDGKSDAILIPGPPPARVSIDPWRQAVREIDPQEAPPSLSDALRRLQRVDEQPDRGWLPGVGRGRGAADGSDPAGKFLVGSPETWPLMKLLCEAVGFEVAGNRLTYRGTTIDLNEGAAVALIDLPGGKRCAIGLGRTAHPMSFGRSRLFVADRLGRHLRSVTQPKVTGPLTFDLNALR